MLSARAINNQEPLTLINTNMYINININMKRPQHIAITSIKYLISYPINMKVSNQVFTTSNSNKCVGGLCLCMEMLMLVVEEGEDASSTTNINTSININ